MKLAILLGVSEYDSTDIDDLNACRHDVHNMHEVFVKSEIFDDICFVSGNCKSDDTKAKIIEFVEKHKSSDIEKIFFYFTGHGWRGDKDFYYVFSDFDLDRYESTGLSNTKLDHMIKSLNPDLAIKLVDACYSGTTYIKGSNNIKELMEKSTSGNSFKNLYFIHSSSSDKASWCNESYSYLTYSFLRSLTKYSGNIYYNAILSSITDDSHNNAKLNPYVVIQADYTEKFGSISEEVKDMLISRLDEASFVRAELPMVADGESKSFAEIVRLETSERYCNKEEVEANILEALGVVEQWRDDDLNDLFEMVLKTDNPSTLVPNASSIGKWLLMYENNGHFAKPTYKTDYYTSKEFIELPNNLASSRTASSLSSIARAFSSKPEYELVDVTNEKKVVDGFRYTVKPPVEYVSLTLNPKLTSLKKYNFNVVITFSYGELAIFTGLQKHERATWDSFMSDDNFEWKTTVFSIKSMKDISRYIASELNRFEKFVKDDIKEGIEIS